MTDTMSYDLANDLLGEVFSGGILSGLAVTNQYDADLRRTNLAALNSSAILTTTAYSYDAASRLANVTDGNADAVTYSYLANSPLVSQIVFKQSGTTRMMTTKQYDYLNRLTQISSIPSMGSAATFNYNYNAANQRTHNTLANGSYWVYGYDSLGQVTNACKYFSDGTAVAGQQFDYAFDTIGNRTQTRAGGDASGSNLRLANYTNNMLNQITQRDVPAFVDVMGASILSNSISVNGQTAYRKGEYFRQQISTDNSSSALWTNIMVSGGQNVTGSVFVAKQPEVFSYDADGNLTNDGRWGYVWDGENRLIQMTNNSGVGPQYGLTFGYDFKGRRIQKIVATNGIAISTNKFLYDRWNLIAELQSSNTLIRSYVWGIDLSGTQQGAGGVGGLLKISYYGISTTNCFISFDGNGNVIALVNTANGAIVGNYEYGPFGEVIRATGPMAKANPIRFSTKYQDDESDLLYYGYRYYKASTGTWLSRDPIQERGGKNLSAFARNDAINLCDWRGLMSTTDIKDAFLKRAAATEAANTKCPCPCGDVSLTYKIGGLVFAPTTVEGIGVLNDLKTSVCGPFNITYYWWDCYSGAEEGDKFDKGWSVGDDIYLKDASPGWEQGPGIIGILGDPNHIDMASVVIYEQCVFGKLKTKMTTSSNRLEFSWSLWNQGWTGPTSNNR